MLSVGIWGATGFMGAPFSRALIKAHRAGRLRFVILHRPQSDLKRLPADIERRCIDFEGEATASIAEKVKDLQVVMSAVSWQASASQYQLIDALKGSGELITFFPSEYASPYRDEDLTSPILAPSAAKSKISEYCAEQGVPCTRLANATVPNLLFNFGPSPALDARNNKLKLYWPMGDGRRGLTSEAFSGEALVYLLLERLSDLPNQSFSLVEISFSAQDLVALFTKLHDGQEPTIVKYTQQDYERDLHKDFLSALGAASKKGLAMGVNWPGEVVSDFPGWQRKTLEDYVRACMATELLTVANFRPVSDLSKE